MPRGAMMMLCSALAFSVMTALVKLAGERLPSQEIVVARAIISLVLSGTMLARAGVSPWGEARGLLWLRGLLGFAGLSCVYAAVTRLPLAEATVLQYMHPALTAILAGVFLGEAITRRIVAATAISLAGVALVAPPAVLAGVLPGVESAALDPFGVAVALGGAMFSAAAYVVVRRLTQVGEHPLVVVFYFPLVTAPAAIPTVWNDFVMPVGFEWGLLLGIGVATQIGQVTLTHGLAAMPAARGTALSYTQVVFAALWGVLFFGETPDAFTFAGAALVIGSAFWLSRGDR